MENQISNANPIRLKDNSKRSQNIIIVFWCIILITVVNVLSGYYELDLLQRIDGGGNYTIEEAEMNDLRQGILAFLQVLVFVVSAITFIMWFRRAYWNTHALRVKRMKYDEGWASYGFMVPFISLFYPYQIASEINETTQFFIKKENSRYKIESLSWIIGIWWTLYLISNVIGQIVFRLVLSGDGTISDLISSNKAYLWSDSLDVVGAAVTLYMIMKISEKEKILYQIVQRFNKELILNTKSM